MAHDNNSSTWEVEGGSEFQGCPQLHAEFKVSLGYETVFQKQSLKSKPKKGSKTVKAL